MNNDEPAQKYCNEPWPLDPYVKCHRKPGHSEVEWANKLLLHEAWDPLGDHYGGKGCYRRWSARPAEAGPS